MIGNWHLTDSLSMFSTRPLLGVKLVTMSANDPIRTLSLLNEVRGAIYGKSARPITGADSDRRQDYRAKYEHVSFPKSQTPSGFQTLRGPFTETLRERTSHAP